MCGWPQYDLLSGLDDATQGRPRGLAGRAHRRKPTTPTFTPHSGLCGKSALLNTEKAGSSHRARTPFDIPPEGWFKRRLVRQSCVALELASSPSTGPRALRRHASRRRIGPAASCGSVSRAFVRDDARAHRSRWRPGVSGRVLAYTPRTQSGGRVRVAWWLIEAGGLALRAAGGGRSRPTDAELLRQRLAAGRQRPVGWLGQPPSALGGRSPAPSPGSTSRLGGKRLVLGPSEDGGYWLIGVRGLLPPIFERMPWSRDELLAQTVSRLSDSGWVEGRDYRLARALV